LGDERLSCAAALTAEPTSNPAIIKGAQPPMRVRKRRD
jgi:hypothetical protein